METSEDIRKRIEAQNATNQSIEHQALAFKKFLATECSDALFDLTEEQVQAVSAIRTGDEVTFAEYGGLPQSRTFASIHFCSLSRSRRRLGRIEGVGLGNRPINNPQQPYNKDIESEREYERAAMREKQGGLLGWFRGGK